MSKESVFQVRSELYEPRVQLFFVTQPDHIKAGLVQYRNSYDSMVDAIYTDSLGKLQAELATHEAELSAAVDDLQERIKTLNDAVRVLEGIGKVLSILGKAFLAFA